MKQFSVRTQERCEFINISAQVQQAVNASGAKQGVCVVYVPHTTAGLTINENADPDVTRDLKLILEHAVPWQGGYAHAEGNSAAHAKASMMGFSQTVFIENGRLAFGTWQCLYFCEFDGPRNRTVWVQIIAAD